MTDNITITDLDILDIGHLDIYVFEKNEGRKINI